MHPGRTLRHRYVLERELGRGSIGVVFAGHDPLLERDVAIKLIEVLEQSMPVEHALEREARLAAKLEHPGIVPVFDFGRDHNLIYLIMPLLHGRPLSERLARGEPLAIPLAAELGRQLALALAYSHAHDVLHRNVKPGNVMLTRDAGVLQVKLLDFGLATVGRGAHHKRKLDATSLPYAAPEQVRGDPVTNAADLYSLGAVLYEALTGRPPFTANRDDLLHAIADHAPTSPSELRPELPGPLVQLLLELLAKQPEQRPPSAQIVAARLQPYADAGVADPHLASLTGPGPSTPLAVETSDVWTLMLHDIVGREPYLRAIDARLLAARAGGLQLVLLAGDAGLGKTALLDELATTCQQRETELLRTSARDESGGWRGSFGELLTAGLAQRPEAIDILSDEATQLVTLFPGLASTRLGRLAQIAHKPRREASWVGLEDVERRRAELHEAPQLDGERRRETKSVREHTEALLVSAFAALVAGGRPLTVAIDDAHVNPETIELVDVLFRRLPRAPLVFVLAYDPTDLRPTHPLVSLSLRVPQHPRGLELRLEPLDERDYEELLVQLLGASGTRPEPGVAASLYLESGGRPLYARELVRAALDAGVLAQRHGVWRFEAARWPIPRSLQTSVHAGLRRLPATLSKLMQLASVLAIERGEIEIEEFAELAALTPDELDMMLTRALELRLLTRGLVEGRWVYRFCAEIQRRIIHSALAAASRHKLHRHCAERIRRLPFSELLDQQRRDLRLAHLLAAGEAMQARPLVIELAQRGLEHGHTEFARRALLDLLELAEAFNNAELGELWLLLAYIEHAREHDHASLDALTRLATLLEQTDEARLSRVGERGAELAKRLDSRSLADRLLGLRPRDRRAAELQRRARAELAALRPATSLRSMQIGDLLLMHGDNTGAREAYDSARRRAAAEQDRNEEARQLQKLARVASRLGHYETAIGYCRDGLELLAGKHSLERVGLWALAAFAHCSGDQFERVSAELEAGDAELATFPEQRSPDRDRVAAELERSRGTWLLAKGDASGAIEAFERGLNLIDTNDRWTLSIARVNLGQACALAGNSSRALREFERATADKRAIGDRLGLVQAQLGRVQVLHDLGQITDAGELLDEACEITDLLEDPRMFAQVRVEHGRNALLAGKLELAAQEGRRAKDMARSSNAPALLAEAHELLASVALARGEVDDAQRMANKAALAAAEHRHGNLLVNALLVLAEASPPELRRELLERARTASEQLGNPYRVLDVSLTSLRLGLGDPNHAGDDYVALEQLSDRAEGLSAQRHVGLCLLAQAEVLKPHDIRGALDHARLGEAQLRVLGARLEADRAAELIARLTLR